MKIAGNRQKAILQGSVVLKCSMFHAHDGMWLRNGKKITHNERQVDGRELMFGAKVMMFNLKIVNVTKNDEGLYMCVGYANGRQANKTFHLETGLFNLEDINYFKKTLTVVVIIITTTSHCHLYTACLI